MSHLSTLKHLKGSVKSTDEDLTSLIKRMKDTLPSPSNLRTFDDAMAYVSNSLTIYVGDALLKQTALLLPEVYDTFTSQLCDLTTQLNVTGHQDIPGSIWLRSRLSSKLEHQMAYKCSAKRVGTVLYRFGGDIFRALSMLGLP